MDVCSHKRGFIRFYIFFAFYGVDLGKTGDIRILNPSKRKIPTSLLGLLCGVGRDRTADTRIFSPLLYRLSYRTFNPELLRKIPFMFGAAKIIVLGQRLKKQCWNFPALSFYFDVFLFYTRFSLHLQKYLSDSDYILLAIVDNSF